jgi:molecular chaperone DnaJ
VATERDYYEVLGVPRDADAKAIKNAFRRLARRYHPDTSNEPDAEERFKEIAEAYGVLSDPAKRRDYDARGFAGVAGASPEDLWGGIDFADVFGAAAQGFGGLFGRLFGHAETGPPRGGDIQVEVAVPLDQVLKGGKRAVTIPRPGPCRECSGSGARAGTAPRPCPGCAGTGQRASQSSRGGVTIRQVGTCPDCRGRGSVVDHPCPACQGTGQAVEHDEVTIRIPPGIPEETVLRLPGRGTPSPVADGEPGDAYLIIRTEADPCFTRAGADLWHDLHITVPDAALGTTAAVPAPDGRRLRVNVPPATQPGVVMRIAGRGLPRYGQHGRGDLNVRIIVDIPRQLSPQLRRLYEELRRLQQIPSQRADPAA